MKNTLFGILFAMLWASASVATKIGIKSVHPFVLADVRFFLAGALMLGYAYIWKKNRLPKGKEWLDLAIFGILNVALYLGLFVIAMKYVAAGIGSLSTATNPLLISLLSAFWIKKTPTSKQWLAILIGMAGVGVATYPLLQNSYATPLGLIIMAGSMLSYSAGTIFFSEKTWILPRIVINAWQVLFGGLFLLPFTFFTYDNSLNHYDAAFWYSVLWLAIPVSIVAVLLWLYLLEYEPLKASLWLFLCPIFGFLYASVLLSEPFTFYTACGTLLVIVGLWIGQRKEG